MAQELCYTAHGVEEDLDALVEACANKIIYSLTLDRWADRQYVGFTIMDGGYQCTCKACEEAKKADGGSYAGAIIRVANRMMEIVKEWMKNNGQADRELNLFFYAYGTTEKAPVIYDEEQGTTAGIRWLQSLDEPGFAMPVMDPLVVKEDYNPEVDDELLKNIGKVTADNILVLVTVTVPSDLTKMSVNLQGPIIINVDECKACQVIVDAEECPVKYFIYDILQARKAGE
jgi:flagellar assembly factor FliW